MVGNQQKMREALVAIQKLVQANIASDEFDDLEPLKEYVQIRDICNAALSAPPRQCDVGTAEEQNDRFANSCDSHSICSQCPVKSLWNFANGHKPSCGVLWAQMPYEAQEGGAE